MKRLLIFLVFVFHYSFTSHGQRSPFEADTSFNKNRTALTSSLIGTGWAGSIIALKEIWYKESLTGNFHVEGDLNQWAQMDKMGHIYAGQLISSNVYNAYRWSGVKKNTSLILGAATGIGYLASFELLDGYSDQWGFSWSDFGANTLGVLWFTTQEMLWEEEYFKLKFSVHPSPYAQYRPEVLGSTLPERFLKDYNGQTYWISAAPGHFIFGQSNFPKWLSISFGYSVDEKLVGDQNYFEYADQGNIQTMFNARRQYFFSLDIDFEQIPTSKSWVKTIYRILNHVKVPFPAVEFSGNQVKFHPVYF
ncbi:MAG: DUF2279 domain-containing protein [Brumimicrobium sp.]|nr:DUF2279 domain-containing protein [Brumimicrobium sp.]